MESWEKPHRACAGAFVRSHAEAHVRHKQAAYISACRNIPGTAKVVRPVTQPRTHRGSTSWRDERLHIGRYMTWMRQQHHPKVRQAKKSYTLVFTLGPNAIKLLA